MIYSHPNTPLIQHLQTVADNSKKVILQKQIDIDIDKSILADLAYIAGAVHDIGKATAYFQHYLLSKEHEVIGPKNHALISSLLAFKVSQRYLQHTNIADLDKGFVPYFIYTSVKRHHGNLQNFEHELLKVSEKSHELIDQAKNFAEGIEDIYIKLFNNINHGYSWHEFINYIINNEFTRELADYYFDEIDFGFFSELTQAEKFKYYYLHQLFYATLLFADKSDVILKEQAKRESALLNFSAIDQFREKKGFNKPGSEIDRLKNEAYFSAIDNIHQIFNPSQHLYSITLPTGLGKTITSIGVALELKKLVKNTNSKIVITIPFTSIIDQNYEVFQSIFELPRSDILLKHHHLAEPSYKVADDEFDSARSQFLIETWQSEIVVTTFVQLFETIFTNDKSKLLKLPNLTNAIIILDEIQQVNYQLWPLIREAFHTLGNKLNCYFILMSATQPLIFEPEKEIKEIIPDHKKYFSFFNRTRLINKTQEKILFDDFTEVVIDYIYDNPDKDILVILNTKNITRECFEKISSLSLDSDVFYLSTLITPYERKKIISLIKDKQSDRQKIIISTQLVEAGVDISVHTVFRAQAPLDSIIQAAGRANRYNENPIPSEVYLYRIDELERGSSMIYGRDLLVKTSNVLKDIQEIDERDYLGLIEAYFKEVYKQSENIVSEYIEAITKLNFKDIGEFKLIKEQNTESIFIQLNEEAVALWDDFTAIHDDEGLNKFQKKAAFSKIKASFYDYVINVPIPYGKSEIDFDSEKTKYYFYLSELENPSSFYQYSEDNYSMNTGYQSPTTMLI